MLAGKTLMLECITRRAKGGDIRLLQTYETVPGSRRCFVAANVGLVRHDHGSQPCGRANVRTTSSDQMGTDHQFACCPISGGNARERS